MGVFTQKPIDTERREVITEGHNGQINPSTETRNETVREELFETPMGGITREPISSKTNNKIRSTKITAPTVATEQKRDSLRAASEMSESKEFSTQRQYQTRGTSGIKRPGKLNDYFLFKDNVSCENFDNDVFFRKGDTAKHRGRETHIGTCR